MLVALRPMIYGTRRLKAGDIFEATRNDASVYCILGLAKDVEGEEFREHIEECKQTMTLDDWRRRWRAIHQRGPDGRWGIDRIRKALGQ